MGKKKACTLSLTVLVCIEMFNAMNAISDESSLLTMSVFLNPWLLVAVGMSMSLHFVILYIPFFANIFGMMPLDLKEWMLVIAFSFPVIIVDEIIKVFVRLMKPQSHFDKKKLE